MSRTTDLPLDVPEVVQRLGRQLHVNLLHRLYEDLRGRHDQLTAARLASEISSFVIFFGRLDTRHVIGGSISTEFVTELSSCLSGLDLEFKHHATRVLMLLGAINKVSIDLYRSHMRELASYGLVILGTEPYEFEKVLPQDLVDYLATLRVHHSKHNGHSGPT